MARPVVPTLRGGGVFDEPVEEEAARPSLLTAPHTTFIHPFASDFRKQQTLQAASHGKRGLSSTVRDPPPPRASGQPSVSTTRKYPALSTTTRFTSTQRTAPLTETARSHAATARADVREPFLMCSAYFKETVHERPEERMRIRYVIFKFFLDDGTMSIRENETRNSGLMQGSILKRQVAMKEDPNLGSTPVIAEDLVIGNNVTIYGVSYHVYDCDDVTREHLEELGIPVPPPEEVPEDDYSKVRKGMETLRAQRGLGHKFDDSYIRFLKDDRKVLCFTCSWDERKVFTGGVHELELKYYLSDNQIQISEIKRNPMNGAVSKSAFLRRQRLPKKLETLEKSMSISQFRIEGTDEDFISADDLEPGRRLNVLGRDILIHDCDAFTWKYLREVLGKTGLEAIDMGVLDGDPAVPPMNVVAPHTGIGSEEDTIRNVQMVLPKPPRQDHHKFIEHGSTRLQFVAKFASDGVHVYDRDRTFVIYFFLADDGIQIREEEKEGGYGGTFLAKRKCARPGTRFVYYTWEDLYEGARVTINKRDFVVTGMDGATKIFLDEHEEEKQTRTIRLMEMMKERIQKGGPPLRKAIRNLRQPCPFEDFNNLLYKFKCQPSAAEYAVILRSFDVNGDGQIDIVSFVEQIVGEEPPTPSMEPQKHHPRLVEAHVTSREERRWRESLKQMRDVVFYHGSHILSHLTSRDTALKGTCTFAELQNALQTFKTNIPDLRVWQVLRSLGFEREPFDYQKLFHMLQASG
eukprot:TRINITY_DN441_c0_g2_i1.p1 TRINITY_DN441_c0_g2~~TRINITY_DN441_c0_g2_i1.p1  ORF type:complete len:747 (-),score=196.98 TRINITY_DN441_c0_g2_i1:1249-3489(-)